MTKREWTPELSRVWEMALEHARKNFLEDPEALAYAETRGLGASATRFGVGYWKGALIKALPSADSEQGRELRRDLQTLGLIDRRGREFFEGCLTFPLESLTGTPGMVGRFPRTKKKGESVYRNLPGQTHAIFNLRVIEAHRELIVVEGVFDAIAFVEAGFENVIALCGLNFPAELLEALARHGTQSVYLALDADPAGNEAAEALASKLLARGIRVYRCELPKGLDPAEYARKLQPSTKSFRFLIDHARVLELSQSGELVRATETPTEATSESSNSQQLTDTPAHSESLELIPSETEEKASAGATMLAALSSLALAAAPIDAPSPVIETARTHSSESSQKTASEPTPSPRSRELPELTPEGVELRIGERWYRMRGLESNRNLLTLSTQITVVRGDARFVDRLDLSLASQRERFERQASTKLSVDRAVIESDLDQLLPLAEDLVTRHVLEVLGSKGPKKVEMTPEERAEGLEFLCSPNMIQNILDDYKTLGVVGEEANKLIVYLAAVSRKTKDPLLVVFSSASGAGKTAIVKATVYLMPEEEVISLSAVTKQAFYYMDPLGLKNKIVVIMEEEGGEPASYSLKLLVSEKGLSIAVPVRDPVSGETRTVVRVVEGPCAIFVTTTQEDGDEEFLNRAIELTINESVEQTLAILQMQKHNETLEGLLESRRRDKIARRHRNAQRLLRPLHVINPFASELEFPGEWLRSRREQPKFLAVARALTLLRQFQRETKVLNLPEGGVLEYLEVARADMELTRRLLRDAIPMGVGDLSPQSRKLLLVIEEWVELQVKEGLDPEDVRFTRKDIWRHAKWSPKQVRTHMQRLVDLEYVGLCGGRQGVTCTYRLLEGVGQPGYRVGEKREPVEVVSLPQANTTFAQRESTFAPTLPTAQGKVNLPNLQARFATLPAERERAKAPRPRSERPL